MPMPTKKRQAASMLNMPTVSAVKMMRMTVDITSDFAPGLGPAVLCRWPPLTSFAGVDDGV